MKTVLVGFQCDPALKAEIVAAATPATVSQYLRSALVEKLRADGFPVSDSLAEAPSRLGKGGPKRTARLDTKVASIRTSDSPAPLTLKKLRDEKYPTAREQRAQKKSKS